MDTQARGRDAERLTGRLLAEHGLEPVASNWHRRVGEIDLIMREPVDATIVFVEVRYRSHGALAAALESVDRAKQRRLRRAARAWLQRCSDPDAPARIDVVAIAPARKAGTCFIDADPERRGPVCRSVSGHRPERLFARRDGCDMVWIVNAVEDDG